MGCAKCRIIMAAHANFCFARYDPTPSPPPGKRTIIPPGRRSAPFSCFTAARKLKRIQILTIKDLVEGKRPHIPWVDPSVFKKARREKTEHQRELDL